uniref:Sec-independent protein translocase protein TatC n=1 Tax=Arsenophonus endosymbiont of Trialeurodes vaporariorum TaxID=235567 RepID=A0A3B0MH30_9GAMM
MSIDDPQPLISHLIELRRRILYSLFTVAVVFLALVYFSNDIYHLVAAPLIEQLPVGSRMSATDVASTFFTPIKLTFMVAVFISIPVILYQLWAFIAPALYKHERRLMLPLLVSSSVLFYLGMIFAYFVVFPLAFGFFVKTTPESVNFIPDISKYLSFVMTLFMVFGAAFEVPVAIILLCWTGVTTPDSLKRKRPYIIVGAFIVGMFLTPPDVFSQTLLAVPMYLLFELGLLLSRFYVGKCRKAADDKNSNEIIE